MTLKYEILQKPSPNYSSRSGRKPIAIVDHITAGAYPGCLSWMQNPAAKASAHYLVTRSGLIIQMVQDSNTSWHAGGVNKPSWSLYDGTNPNRYTLGIEHEGYSNQGGDGTLTEAQYQATLWLHQQLISEWQIPIDEDHIIGHYRIDSVNRPNCPGHKFPWNRLFSDLRKGVIDVALAKWMIEDGEKALDELAKKGLINMPETKKGEKKLAASVPAYMFWVMINRLADYKGGKVV